MAGSMSQADLVDDLKRSLHDCAGVFNAPESADFVRFLKQALPDMGWKRPRTLLGQVTLSVNEPRFSLAGLPDFHAYKMHVWQTGAYCPQAWEPGYAGALPRVGSHGISTVGADTTVALVDRPLLLLRAQAEAMLELTLRNAAKPVQLRDGLSGTPRNSTPAALHATLLAMFAEAR
jgi:hypothetical protein